MNKALIYSSQRQVVIIMGLITKIVFCILFLSKSLFCSILLEKNDIMITSLDIDLYKKSNFEKNTIEINETQLIKKIYLIKKTLKRISEKNPEYLSFVEKKLNLPNNFKKDFSNELLKYYFIRNEFINDYLINKLTIKDISDSILLTKNLKIPLSLNNCLTVDLVVNISEINNFDKKYFQKVKDPNFIITQKFDSTDYNVCLPEEINKKIEYNLMTQIEKKTELDFKNYIYEK